MKGLVHIPTIQDLQNAYHHLQNRNHNVDIPKLALWSQWSRFDARLGEQWVAEIFQYWKTISPVTMNQEIQKQPWPAAMGVLLEQVFLGFVSDRKLFRQWIGLAMFGIKPAHFEQYFIGTSLPGSPRMLEEVFSTTKPYAKWGYFGKDLLWNKSKIFNRTLPTQQSRLNILEELIKKQRRITVRDYIEKLGGAIHQRQAQRDLANHPRLCHTGTTNNRVYFIP